MTTPSPINDYDADITTVREGDKVTLVQASGDLPRDLLREIDSDYRPSGYNGITFVARGSWNPTRMFVSLRYSGTTFRATKYDMIRITERKVPYIPPAQDFQALSRSEFQVIWNFARECDDKAAQERALVQQARLEAQAFTRQIDTPNAQRCLGKLTQHARQADAWETVSVAMDAMLANLKQPAEDKQVAAEIVAAPIPSVQVNLESALTSTRF